MRKGVVISACHNRRGKEGATTKGGGEGGVDSKAREGKELALVITVVAWTTTTITGEQH